MYGRMNADRRKGNVLRGLEYTCYELIEQRNIGGHAQFLVLHVPTGDANAVNKTT